MTTATIPVADLQQQAREARPGHVLATAFVAVFVGLGWLAGKVIALAVFAGVGVRYGFWRGRGLTDEEIAARNAPPQQPQPRGSKL